VALPSDVLAPIRERLRVVGFVDSADVCSVEEQLEEGAHGLILALKTPPGSHQRRLRYRDAPPVRYGAQFLLFLEVQDGQGWFSQIITSPMEGRPWKIAPDSEGDLPECILDALEKIESESWPTLHGHRAPYQWVPAGETPNEKGRLMSTSSALVFIEQIISHFTVNSLTAA